MADKKKGKTETQDVSTMSAQELAPQLKTALEQRAKLAFQHNVAPLKDSSQLRKVRREIARLKTYIRAKETAK